LLTLFGESEDSTHISYDPNDFKYSDFFDEQTEVLADTLWSSPNPRELLIRDEHGCLMSSFDVYTVTITPYPYGLLTEMSAPPHQHRGARPKTTVPTARVRYACVACEFSDFQTAHSLRRHVVQVHDLSSDTSSRVVRSLTSAT